MRLIIEGLTGTGKSQTLAAMDRLGLLPPVVVHEEETFGDVMDELAAGAIEPVQLVRRLEAVRVGVVEPGGSFVLERFHFSYYALVPDWSLYELLDARLFARGTSVVLLTVPDDELLVRSLRRREHNGSDWQGLAEHFGSEEAALDNLRRSQQRRIEALGYSRLRQRVIDTSAEAWDDHAREIAAWASQPVRTYAWPWRRLSRASGSRR